MAMQAAPKKAAPSWVDNLRTWANETMIVGRPVMWYVTGWRFSLIILLLAVAFPWIPYSVYPGIQGLVGSMSVVWIYVMLALGLNIVVGYAGLLDLGYVAFFAIGSYTYASGTFGYLYDWAKNPVAIPTFPPAVLLVVGAVIAGIFGVLLGFPTLRLRGDYLAIVTLGFGEIVPIVFQNLPTFGGNKGITASSLPPIVFNGTMILNFNDPLNAAPFYYVTLTLAVLIVLGVLALRDSSVGRAWVAIREDETAAEASGVNLRQTKLLAFAMGAFVGGIGGVLWAIVATSISPATGFSFQTSITIVIMIVLGGIGSVPGVIVGAIILRLTDAYLLGLINDPIHNSSLVSPAGAPLHFLANVDFNSLKYLIYGIVLVVMILLRPQGLIPDARRKRELKGIGAAPEDMSAVGMMAAEEAGVSIPSVDSLDRTMYTGDGSDAQGGDQ